MSGIRIWIGALVVGLALTLGACGGGDGGVTVPTDATPQEVAEVAGLREMHSGAVEATLFVTKLKKNQAISFRVNGNFKGLGEGNLPQLFLATISQGKWNGHAINLNGLLSLLSDGGTISYGSTAYRIGSSTLENVRSKLRQAQEGDSGNLTACLHAAQGVDLAELIRDPQIEKRRKEADDTKVLSIRGYVVIGRLRNLLVRLARNASCGAQMKALGFPSAEELGAARVDFHHGVRGAPLTVAVDRHGIIRSLSIKFECARVNGEFFELRFDFKLGEVNRAIGIPSSTEGRSLDDLLQKFGTTQEAILRAGADEAVIAFLEGLGGAMTGRLP